ncbi:MAG: family 78 glycoside hydrolase catalytic domain, partial [candidate division KSB1 bacterium]|nr:family 78 glycoside hydrolase catalytic domain [candidate division KSB1 bacterium]
ADVPGSVHIVYRSHQELPEFLGPWQGQNRGVTAGNPAWDMAWRMPDSNLNLPSHQVSDITLTDESALVFDMGGKILGRIFIEYTAPEGTRIDIGFAEDLTSDSLASVLKRPGIYTATRHISAGGSQRHETFKPYGARYLQVNVTGNRGPVTLKRLGMVSQIYPFEKIGSFTCSDPLFNEIWELGWRTLLVCAEDTYTDTPFRERGLYAGDALPQFAITLAGSGDPRLIKYSLEVFQDKYRGMFYPDKEKSGDEPGLLYDFPFITLEYFRWYVDWSGDIEFAAELYDNYRYMVENAVDKQQKNGLFANLPAFVEWTRIDKRAQLTMMQSLLARSFENMAHLAAKLDKPDDMHRYKQLVQETVQAVNRLCWDEKRGAYRDGFKNGEPIDHHYPISSAWMSLSGYNSKPRETILTDFYRTELADIGEISRARKVTPYGGFYVLGALYRHNRADIAERFIRQYWTRMILNHNDTAWENFDDGSGPSSGQGTLSHAWSGGPTYYMTTDILGVRLGFPCFYSPDTVRIEPLAESITWAEGTVPHPDGVVEVQWRVKGDQLFLNYTAPEGVTCIVKPRGRLADKRLWINGSSAH